MALANSPSAYGSVSKTLHWLIALLIILMLAGGFFMDDIANKSLKMTVFNLHKLTGILILVLMVCRLVWRLSNPRPDLAPQTPRFEKVMATLGHSLLYVLVIAMPLSGWIMSTAADHAPTLGGLSLALPFIARSQALSALFYSYHQTIAWVIIAIIVLHVAAALKHHFIDKDQVLKGML